MDKNTFANMKIKNVIVHQIYKRDMQNNAIPPFYNTECEKLNDIFTNKLKERIIKSLGKESHSIRMRIVDDAEESVYSHISQYWSNKKSQESFIDISKKITDNLADAQDNRRYPDSLILCIEGTIQNDDREFICIVKAESQDGFYMDRGKEKIGLNYLDNLFMTKNERFQKLAIFIKKIDGYNKLTKELVDVFIFDSNTNSSASKSKAVYFYSNFLGLDFREDSDKQTLDFFTITKDFINSSKLSDVEKIKISTSLLNYIKDDANAVINAADFSCNFSDPAMKDIYLKNLESHNLDTNSIYKNTTMLGSSLKYRNLTFSNNVKMQIPVDEFSDIVEITKEDNGVTVIKIKGMMLNEK